MAQVKPLPALNNWNRFDFGHSLAANGVTLAVGVPYCRTPASQITGCIAIYRLQAAGWTRTAKIYPPEPAENSEFGRVVALCGDRLAVGAPGAERVYVYEQR